MVFYRVQPHTILRAEEKSALWFNPQTAETLSLDLEGLEALKRLGQGKKNRSLRGWVFKNHLLAKGFLSRRQSPPDVAYIDTITQEAHERRNPANSLYMPEALHISLTDACNQSCQGCFFSQQNKTKAYQYMPLEQFKALIKQAQKYRVFQIAMGGGEPLMHPQLIDMIRYAKTHQVLPNLTTNGALLTLDKVRGLKEAGLGQLQVSLNGSTSEINQITRPQFEKVLKGIQHLKQADMRWGLNVLVTRQNIHDLENILQLAQNKKAHTVNILRPKAGMDKNWLKKTLPDSKDNKELQGILKRWQKKAHFQLVTDSSLGFLRQGTKNTFLKQGISGCSAGQRILSVGVDGRISPCGHISLYDGLDDLKKVWHHSEHFNQFRHISDHLEGVCKTCELKSVCKGCRAIALEVTNNFYGEDPSCPKRLATSS